MKRLKLHLDCKIVKLKPLYKKGSKIDPKDYCPVSLLPLVSKVIEKVIQNQTKIFLNKNKILYKYQWGFQKSFSTNSCLTLLTGKINKRFWIWEVHGFNINWLKKSFWHNRSWNTSLKMGCTEFLEKVILWFESFLSGRTFKVNINKKILGPRKSYLQHSPRIYIRSTFVFVIH